MTKPSTWIASLAVAIAATAAVLADAAIYIPLAVGAAVFVLLAFARPRVAMLLWLIVAPVADAYGTMQLPGPDITFSRAATALVAIALMLRMILKGRRLVPFSSVELAMLGLLAIMTLDLALRSSNLNSDALQEFDLYITPIVLFLCARHLFTQPSDVKRIGYGLVLVGCYLAAHGAYQAAAPSANPTAPPSQLTTWEGGDRTNESHLEGGRSVGPFNNAVEYGGVVAIAGLVALLLALHGPRGIARMLVVTAVAATAVGVVLSATRSVWLGAYLGLWATAMVDRQRRKTLLLVIGGVTAAALIAAVVLSDSSSLKERVSSLEPIYARTVMYRVAATLALRQPLLGYGRGGPSRAAARTELHSVGGSDAALAAGQFHNVFVALLVEWGVGGVICYAAIFVLFARAALRLRQRATPERGLAYHFAGFFLAATVVVLVQGLLVDLPAFLYLNGVYFTLAGLVHAQLDATTAFGPSPSALIATPALGSSARGFATAMPQSRPWQ